MRIGSRSWVVGSLLPLAAAWMLGLAVPAATAAEPADTVSESVFPDGVRLESKAPFDEGTLVVSGASGTVLQEQVERGERVFIASSGLSDGNYRYELVLVRHPVAAEVVRLAEEDADGRGIAVSPPPPAQPFEQRKTGRFTVKKGVVQQAVAPEPVEERR